MQERIQLKFVINLFLFVFTVQTIESVHRENTIELFIISISFIDCFVKLLSLSNEEQSHQCKRVLSYWKGTSPGEEQQCFLSQTTGKPASGCCLFTWRVAHAFHILRNSMWSLQAPASEKIQLWQSLGLRRSKCHLLLGEKASYGNCCSNSPLVQWHGSIRGESTEL